MGIEDHIRCVANDLLIVDCRIKELKPESRRGGKHLTALNKQP